MENKTIIRILVLGAIVILSMLAFQSYNVFNKWSQENKNFTQTAYIALNNVARRLAQLNQHTLPSRDLIKQLSANYFVVNINNHIDAGVLEQYLLEEFQEHGLNMDFEYGIYDCASDEMVYGDFCRMADREYKNTPLGDLPKYEEFIYYFGVKFPNISGFIIDNIKLAVIFSIISLLAIIFFVYSVYIILKQKKLSELQKDFINNMTHEFKTPISSIKLASETLMKNESVMKDEKLQQYTHIIHGQNQRLNDHIEKILSLAKLERDQFKLKLEPVDVHQLIRQVLQPINIKISELEGKLTLHLNAQNTTVQADRLHLTNVLNNLIDNAVKYRRGTPDITIITEERKGKIHCVIADKGIGIADEHRKKLFTKFYRVPTGNIHNVKGFGLGLFYVKNVCDAHGWELDVSSKLGEGTTMLIKFLSFHE